MGEDEAAPVLRGFMGEKTLIDIFADLAAICGNANGRVIMEEPERFRAKFMDISGGRFRPEAKVISEFIVSEEAMTMKISGAVDAAALRDIAEHFHNNTLYEKDKCEMAAAASAWLIGLIDRKTFETVLGVEKAAEAPPPKTPEPKKTSEPIPEGLVFQIIEGKSVTIARYTGNASTVDIPGRIKDLPVTAIGIKAFKDCGNLTSVTMPSSVTFVGDYAFHNCCRLANVTMPPAVEFIGKLAFAACVALTSVVLPSSLVSIGEETFRSCANLTSVEISSSVTSIGAYAFQGCGKLKNIDIPSSVTSIGDYAFSDCKGLLSSSVNLPSSLVSIGAYAFANCVNLVCVDIPSPVMSIGNFAFIGCPSLISVVIPPSATSIGEYAFNGCHNLTSVTLSTSLVSIGAYAFFNCDSLESIDIPSTVTFIGEYAFYNCMNLKNISLSQHTKKGGDAFDYAANINIRED